MVNESKVNDPRFWRKWEKSGAVGDIYGQKRGEAYSYFDCDATPEQIAEEIPKIRELVKTPKGLELYFSSSSITPIISIHTVDSELLGIIADAKDARIKYALAARGTPNMTNRETADELAGILNQAYQSPLYKEGEQFRGDIFYKENERYVSRE